MRRRRKQLLDVSATHLYAKAAIVPSWQTRQLGWITHLFDVSYSIIGNSSYKMSFLCCDLSIDFIFMTLDYNVFCRVISKDVILMSLFIILRTIDRKTKIYCYLWIPPIYHDTMFRIHAVGVVY
jgi:hypothetical protein